jgi:hypothetical protein
MNCRQCRELLDDLLVAQIDEATGAAFRAHLEQCTDCAREHAAAEQALAILTPSQGFRATPDLKESIMNAISETNFEDARPDLREFAGGKTVRWGLAVTAAAAVVAAVYVLGPQTDTENGGNGRVRLSALGLFAKASAAEELLFTGNDVVHIENEIVVKPTDDPNWARARWLPIISLELDGKTRFHQLSLPAEVGQGYTIKDESWYDPATGRFVRLLTADKRPLFASAYDGKAVYWLELIDGTASTVVRREVSEDFQAPESPAEYLGIAAGFQTSLDEKNEEYVLDAGTVKVADGVTARILKAGFPKPEGDAPSLDAYYLFTIREDNNTIVKMEFFADEKSLLVVKRVRRESVERPGVPWDLAGIEEQAKNSPTKSPIKILSDMVIPSVTIEHMVEKADFETYVFSTDPAWAGPRQITDILDVVSPPRRMFAIAHKANDGRHVVLVQAHTYNKMLGPMAEKTGEVIYTSPSGIKVLSSSRGKWLAGLLLQSARASIESPPSGDRTGYLLQTPSGTFPALAVNGQMTDEELHVLIDSLTLAKKYVDESDTE